MAELGKYSIELFREGGEGAGIEAVLVRHDNLAVSRALYKGAVLSHPNRLVMLCDRARVLARSDRPETWTSERLEQAAVDESIQHGGNQRDVQQLQAELQKAYANKSGDGVTDDNRGTQTGEIPD